MGIQNLSDHVLLITLPAEPQSENEAEMAMRAAGARADCDVIVNFSLVEIMSSATLCSLLVLERMLSTTGHELILCCVPPKIAGVFTRVGLNKLFRFADDQFAALQALDGGALADPRST